jgi:hypothetical protein
MAEEYLLEVNVPTVVRQINGKNRSRFWSIEPQLNLFDHRRFANSTDADQTHTGSATHSGRPDQAFDVGDERLAAVGFDP